MNHKATTYDSDYDDGIYGRDYDEDEQPSDTSIADLARDILTEAGAIRECEVGAIPGAVTEMMSSAAAVTDGIIIVPIDTPRVVPEIQPAKCVCDPHFERTAAEVPADREILGTRFCESCFTGEAIHREIELVGEIDNCEKHSEREIVRRSRIKPAAGERERSAQRRYWQRHREEIMARRHERILAKGGVIRRPGRPPRKEETIASFSDENLSATSLRSSLREEILRET